MDEQDFLCSKIIGFPGRENRFCKGWDRREGREAGRNQSTKGCTQSRASSTRSSSRGQSRGWNGSDWEWRLRTGKKLLELFRWKLVLQKRSRDEESYTRFSFRKPRSGDFTDCARERDHRSLVSWLLAIQPCLGTLKSSDSVDPALSSADWCFWRRVYLDCSNMLLSMKFNVLEQEARPFKLWHSMFLFWFPFSFQNMENSSLWASWRGWVVVVGKDHIPSYPESI